MNHKTLSRHCEERSDAAIQSHKLGKLDCFVATAPRNDELNFLINTISPEATP